MKGTMELDFIEYIEQRRVEKAEFIDWRAL